MTLEELKIELSQNEKLMIAGLMTIYDNQEADERICKDVSHSNGKGFTIGDAHILTSFAEFYNQCGFLSPKQKAIAFKLMPKYARQLKKEGW